MAKQKTKAEIRNSLETLIPPAECFEKTVLDDECTAALNAYKESNAPSRKSKRKRTDDDNGDKDEHKSSSENGDNN